MFVNCRMAGDFLMKALDEQKKGMLMMCACAGLWSISGLFIKLLPWNPLVITGWRSLIAGFCVLIYMRFSRLRVRVNHYSLASASLMVVVMFAFVSATKLTTAANAIVLQFTAPVFVMILSALLFHQRFSRADIFTVAATMGGIALFFFDQLDLGSLIGNLLAIGAGLGFGCMFLVNSRANMEERMSGILLGQFVSAFIGIPLMFVFDTPLNSASIFSILVLGIFQLGIPYILYGCALKSCPPLACSLLDAVEPLLNPVWVFLVTGERPGAFALCGGVIVIVTITLWCVRRDKVVGSEV
ncbi:EamA/RhaT family transporter [Anaerotruncus sp. AF02-27]|nr:EamA/RhaT family transporter [Anaerotruncus sp. AF02-27]